MVERAKSKLCPVRLCITRYQTRDGLRAHLFTKHSKLELIETLRLTWLRHESKASADVSMDTIKSRVVEALLDEVFS